MNWYFEEKGTSRGPITEEELRGKVQEGILDENTLIWNPTLKEWGTIVDVMPDWLAAPAPKSAAPASVNKKPETAQVPETPPAAEKKRPSAKTVPEAAPASTPATVLEEDVILSSEAVAQTQAPAQTKLKPKAPVAAEADPAPKSGILKRVFGLGGKKK